MAADYAQALRWYRLAAEQAQGTAINNLGIMYLEGKGVAKDVEEAKRLFKQAIEKGVAKAKDNLAVAEVKNAMTWLLITNYSRSRNRNRLGLLSALTLSLVRPPLNLVPSP